MKLIVNDDKLNIESTEKNNAGSINYYKIPIEFNSAWDGLTKELLIRKEKEEIGIHRAIIGNVVGLDKDTSGTYVLGIVGYRIKYEKTQDSIINYNKRYFIKDGDNYIRIENYSTEDLEKYYEAIKEYQISTNLKRITINQGAGEIDVEDEYVPSITEWELYIQQIQDIIKGITMIPQGGLQGQVLTKKTDSDYDYEWKTPETAREVKYEDLTDKPQIGGKELIGNKSLEELGIQHIGNYVEDENYVHTDNNYSNDDKQKLAGLSNYDDSDVIKQIEQVNELAEQNERDITNLGNRTTVIEQDYIKDTDYATSNKGGTIKVNDYYCTDMYNGLLRSKVRTYDRYKTSVEDIFISKGTLENVLKNEIPDVSEFIKKTANDLVNYYKKTETYTQTEVNQLIGAIKTVSMKVVPEKPEVGETNIIYLIPSPKQETENIYDEYIYVDNKWELIGSTKVDLSNVYTKDEINTLLFDYITSNDLEEALINYVLTDLENIDEAGIEKIKEIIDDSGVVKDVKIAGTTESLVTDGVATIPAGVSVEIVRLV